MNPQHPPPYATLSPMTAFPDEHAAYPPAPWRLAGPALITACLVPIARVRRFIPAELPIVPILPGFTLGGLLLAAYQSPPATLGYHELIAFSGLVSHEGKRVFWVSHIYVDLEASLHGGREIWGLPKELGTFTWVDSPRFSISVRQQDVGLVAVTAASPLLPMTRPVKTAAASLLDGRITASRGYGLVKAGPTRAQVYIPPESPLAPLGLDRPMLAVSGEADLLYLPPR